MKRVGQTAFDRVRCDHCGCDVDLAAYFNVRPKIGAAWLNLDLCWDCGKSIAELVILPAPVEDTPT